MRVARIEFDGIGPFEKASFEIPPPQVQSGELVLFEGPNGSGKSTVMEAIAMAVALAAGAQGHLLGIEDQASAQLPRWPGRFRRLDGRAGVEIEHGQDQARVVLQRSYDSSPVTYLPPLSALTEALASFAFAARFQAKSARFAAFSYRGRLGSALLDTHGPAAEPWRVALEGALSFAESARQDPLSLGQFLKDRTYERLVASEAASRSQNDAERTAAAATARAREESMERLRLALERILDRRIEFVFPLGRLDPKVTFDGEEIEPDLLGEGLRSTFSWLSDLLMRLSLVHWEDAHRSPFDQEFWLILDEIDESLHPLMQARLFPELRKLFPNAHIYATTHSPFAVAACTDGWVFPIRPRAGDHRVTGAQRPEPLEAGQSLEYVVEKVFAAPSTFVDEPTRVALATHLDGVKALRGGAAADLEEFRKARAFLMSLNDEVRTIVVMREGPIRRLVEQQLAGPLP